LIDLGAGYFSAIRSAPPVIAVSSFRDMKGIGVVSAIPAGPSAAVVQGNQPFQYIVVIFLHALDRIG
jgi:hypothetical protein